MKLWAKCAKYWDTLKTQPPGIHQAVACVAGTYQNLHQSRGPGKPTLTDIQATLRSTEVQASWKSNTTAQQHQESSLLNCYVISNSNHQCERANKRGKQHSFKNCLMKKLRTKESAFQVKTFLHSWLWSMFWWERKNNESQETLIQETNMWMLWLGHIHGLADAGEGGSTRQEERKLWVASVGRSLNLLTCKRAEQLDAIRSSVLAMLTLSTRRYTNTDRFSRHQNLRFITLISRDEWLGLVNIDFPSVSEEKQTLQRVSHWLPFGLI